jgi:hypothetical protein
MVATRTAAPAEPGAAAPAGGTLPNLVVIGAMKCGTSALHYYLDLHPEIQMSSPKELGFFAAEAVVEGPLATAAESEQRIMRGGGRNWERGIEWYAGHFDPAASVRGEASPAYTAPWFPRSAELIASILPDTRLIFMVRDPLEQIVSQYLHYRHAGNEPRELNEAVADPHGIYVERARYHARLQPFLERFPEERILVLSQEELLHSRRQTLAAALAFSPSTPPTGHRRWSAAATAPGERDGVRASCAGSSSAPLAGLATCSRRRRSGTWSGSSTAASRASANAPPSPRRPASGSPRRSATTSPDCAC